MKAKKKSTQIKSTSIIKLLNVKTSQQPQKNTASTKQKTFATIQQNLRTFENVQSQGKRESLKGRFSFNRKSYVQRMQQNNLSPFSNDGRSLSPKRMKTPEKLNLPKDLKQGKFAVNLKQLQKKKSIKSKVNSARQGTTKKINIIKTVANNNLQNELKKKVITKKKSNKSQKNEKQEKARIQFQNQFLSMMNNRIHKQKITEMSDQELQCSKKRKPKLQICINATIQNDSKQNKISTKCQIVKTMKLKVMNNIQRDYPNLDVNQKKVMCAVIIIQRLWRQRKVKQFFQHYVTPKGSPETSFQSTFQKQLSNNRSTMNILSNHLTKKSQQITKFDEILKKRSKSNFAENNFLIRQKSSESCTISDHKKDSRLGTKQQAKLNDKVNKLLEETISFENQNEKIVKQESNLDHPAMMKFLECYREIKLSNKKSSKSKRNIFSLKQSLSQKCLMQKYYTKIFSDKPEKDQPKNYQLFIGNGNKISASTLKQNQQSSIQLFKQINNHPDYISPRKQERKQEIEQEQEVWIRNETNYSQETDSDQLSNKKQQILKTQKLIVDEGVINFEQVFCKTASSGEKNVHVQIQQILIPQKNLQSLQKQPEPSIAEIIINGNKKQAVLISQKVQPSLKSIQKVAEQLITQLMNEFFIQYIGFRQKQCLVKKHKSSSKQKQKQKEKKPRLPGIQISKSTINQYLNILIPYMFAFDREEIIKSLQLFNPRKYQKCHRVESKIYQIFYFDDQQYQDDDIYWNIISNDGFFKCLEQYWINNVKLTKQTQKFTNFLDLTYKVYNRCITDAFSQIFNKQVLQMIVYPWDGNRKYSITKRQIKFKQEMLNVNNSNSQSENINSQSKNNSQSKSIQTIAQQVKQKLLKQSFCYSSTNGKLYKKQRKQKIFENQQFQFGQKPKEDIIQNNLSEDQFIRIQKISNDEYLQDEKQLMVCADQRYELNGDLSQSIFDTLIQQIQQELLALKFIENQSELQVNEVFKEYNHPESALKEENQQFLQTNQTLQTNCQF